MNNDAAVDIILVEDDPRDAEMILRAFKKQNIVNPLFVLEDGAEALDFIFCRGDYLCRKNLSLPKIILLDLKLPKISGLEVLKAIKTDKLTNAIPVIVVTSSQEDPDVKAAYALGANSYVVKPVSSDDFMQAMSHLGLYWLLVNKPPK